MAEIKLPQEQVTEKDLHYVKFLNTRSIAGQVNDFASFTDLIGWVKNPNLTDDEIIAKSRLGDFGWLLISSIKNWQLNLFNYSGLPDEILPEEIEKLLYWFGRACIYKIGNKYYVSTYSVEKWDFYYYPKIIRPIVPNPSGYKLKNYDVSKGEAVILWNDNSFIFNRVSLWGTLFKIWGLLLKLVRANDLINRNMITSKQWVKMPSMTSAKNIAAMYSILRGENLIIPMEMTYGSGVKERGKLDDLTMSFDDKTGPVWENYYNCWDQLSNFLGLPTNANVKKKERQITDEIEINNVFSNCQIEAMLKARQYAVKQMKKGFGWNVSISLNQSMKETRKDGEHGEEKNRKQETSRRS